MLWTTTTTTKKMTNNHYHPQSSQTLLWDCDIHMFVVSMKTTGVISLKIWNTTVWMVSVNVVHNTWTNLNLSIRLDRIDPCLMQWTQPPVSYFALPGSTEYIVSKFVVMFIECWFWGHCWRGDLPWTVILVH